MEIKNVQLKTSGDHLILEADCKIRKFVTDRLYFKFENKYESFISPDASPFAAALLIPSMRLGQHLVIKGSISEKLYENMHEIMQIYLSWNLGLKPIKIIADKLNKDKYQSEQNASFFSGGVDSFFTYLKHKTDGVETINYFILALGFDIDLDNRELWQMTCKTVEDVANVEGVGVIKVESNIHDLIEPIMPWDYTHGGCLAALGLSLRNELKNVYIASSATFEQQIPWGTHAGVDHLWSTETLSFHHDGTEFSRVEKTKFIASNPLVQKNLRVCYENHGNKFNCGICEKCIRTMIGLSIAGELDKIKTFPDGLDLELVRRMNIPQRNMLISAKENLEELKRHDSDINIIKALEESIGNSKANEFDKMTTRKLIARYWLLFRMKIRFFDFYYNQDRIYKTLKTLAIKK